MVLHRLVISQLSQRCLHRQLPRLRSLSNLSPPPPPQFSQNISARLVEALPDKVQPYAYLARIDKPAGSWLLYWPCAWSITMAAAHGLTSPSHSLYMLALFGSGAVIMRGAGCTINDLWDKDLDRAVERTQGRPLASGMLSQRQAMGFLAVQLSAGLLVLMQLNTYRFVELIIVDELMVVLCWVRDQCC